MSRYWVLTLNSKWMKYSTAMKKKLTWSVMVMERPYTTKN